MLNMQNFCQIINPIDTKNDLNTRHRIQKINPSRHVHFRKLYQNKDYLNFLFLHLFLVPQKLL